MGWRRDDLRGLSASKILGGLGTGLLGRCCLAGRENADRILQLPRGARSAGFGFDGGEVYCAFNGWLMDRTVLRRVFNSGLGVCMKWVAGSCWVMLDGVKRDVVP